ncbi:hypothetical protein BIU82_10065 [Arthrobacter sp. SW1]|uniref:DUF308 domain-containing protein n=1 Tax=Arthrobacter sp. SW1 TaxID=1920889 RepID=UPI000877DB8A|nr:DUF308 domain-containing protein [Arthrobacter sp. SW1]OFI37398.1 hypothetical protein BIU82_10065 [Arthrobacter sp. SW1]
MTQPTYQAPQFAPQPEPKRGNGFGVAALVLGIVAIVASFIPVLGTVAFILGPLAVLFGLLGIFLRKGTPRGTSITGIILGALSIVIAIIVTVMTAAFVGAVDDALKKSDPSVSNAAPAVESPAQGASVPPSEAPADRSADFGGTVKYDNGVSVTVKSLGFTKVGQYATGAVEGQAAVFELTVHNGSKEDLEAVLMSVPNVTHGPKNAKASMVIDSSTDLGLQTLSTILPGESQTVKFAAGVPKTSAGSVRVEVTGPNMFSDKDAIFKGAVK